MAALETWSDSMDRKLLVIRKHHVRSLSQLFYNTNQTPSIAEGVYSQLLAEDAVWERDYDLVPYLVAHDYSQRYENVKGDAYSQLCAFGQAEYEAAEENPNVEVVLTENSSRRVVSAVCCHTVEIPNSVVDQSLNVNHVDIDSLVVEVVGDAWLREGCFLAVFVSNDEHPPTFGSIVQRMNTPGAEKQGENCWAGFVGAELPTDPNAVRYLRTNVICNTLSISSNPDDWNSITEKLVFKIHDWAMNDYDEETGTYDIKKYLHVMLFLDQKQYVTTRRNWIEGSAFVNLSNLKLTFTGDVLLPLLFSDLCSKPSALNYANDYHSLEGGLFSLVNIFKMTDSQAASLSKNNGELCVFSAIESAIGRIQVPSAVYGFKKYPPITASGFDFYTVGVDGVEYVRIGCIDENAMYSIDTPLPSVYGVIIGYPINPGISTISYERIMLVDGANAFSGCIRLKVVVYQGMYESKGILSGDDYGFGTVVDRSKFDAKLFFSGSATSLVLNTGESVKLSRLYLAHHTQINDMQEFKFDNAVSFSTTGMLLIGVVPVEFSLGGTMTDGDWGQYMASEYKSQYMQLVEWPISTSVMVSGVE